MNTKPNIGDKVVITDPSLDHLYGKEFVVVQHSGFDQWTNADKRVWLIDQDKYGNNYGSCFFVYLDSCELVKPKAKVGDIIEIIVPGFDDGSKYAVINSKNDPPEGCIWAIDILGTVFWVRHIEYRIIKLADSPVQELCPECRGNGTVELLTTTVKCKLCNKG